MPVVYNEMSRRKQLAEIRVGGGVLTCFDESDAYETISDLLTADVLCLTDGRFDPTEKDMRYHKTGKVVSV
jgi:hypothetical protein